MLKKHWHRKICGTKKCTFYKNDPKIVKIVVFLLLIHLSFHSYSQFAVGVRAGANWSKVDFYPKIPQEYYLGNHYGMLIRYISEPHFGIQVEANITRRGWRELKAKKQYYQRSFQTLEIPILTHINIGKKKLHLILNGGFDLTYLRSSEEELFIKDEKISRKYEFIDKIDKRYGYGLLFGGGLEYLTKIGCFQIEGRYYLGLTDIIKPENARKTDYARNRVIQLTMAYVWAFKQKKTK